MKNNSKRLLFSASKDFIFSVLALVIYNGVLQLLIYPGLESRVGADAFGTVLYLISAVSIMGAGFGTAASYSRMVAKKVRTESNGDYNLFLLIVAGISVLVSFVALMVLGNLEVSLYFQVLLLMIITVYRYYADVEWRMTIRFKDYFIFFGMVSIGYVIGLLIYPVTKSWAATLFIGEALGILYTFFRGSIFRSPYTQLSDSFKDNMKSFWYISASNLLAALILHSDRILLRLVVGGREVTVFYAASLIGKIIAMLTTPLNGVIISYLTNYKIELDKKKFGLISGVLLILTVVGALACTGVSYIFVKIMYPDIFQEATRYFFLANLGQILYFISGSLMVVIMSFSKEKMQLVINSVYGAGFCLIVIPMTMTLGINGIAYGLVIISFLRYLLAAIIGIRKLSK
ncbi:lipopolysaccharide biosynthesis protein [Butyrivibrio sp.]|uniref:lipopolysaccharide biosynthesis protein n=1 Tax=Butyrivibrio sp. TaxID=28121 RepID=UPI0025BB9853|nr:hypothetical protein [Butyrivibrio sp.]MBQ9305302.1 hypothetical protein [Butyrivibrio sp.]